MFNFLKKRIDYNKLIGKTVQVDLTCGDEKDYIITGIKSYEKDGIWLTLDDDYIYEAFITYKLTKLILKDVKVISYARRYNFYKITTKE